MLEPLYNYKVTVLLPNGNSIVKNFLAHTTYHAIDKAFTRYSHMQQDRKKYSVKEPIIRVR